MANNTPTPTYAEFNGLVTTQDEIELGLKGFTKAVNIDISSDKKIRRRKGQTLINGTAVDSAAIGKKYFLYTSGTDLYRFDGSSSELVRSGITAGGHIVAEYLNGKIYYSNGYENGVISGGADRTLGLTAPGPVILSEATGKLCAGRYQCVVTYVRNDGQESGASEVSVIEIQSDDAGIAVSSIPMSTDPTVEYVNIYLTNANGSEFYLALTQHNGVTDAVFAEDTNRLNRPLLTQYNRPIPPFSVIGEHNGRMVYGIGEMLVYSQPFMYEAYDARFAYLPMNGKITMIASADSGLFVGTNERTIFLRGDDVRDAQISTVSDCGVVAGTLRYIPAEYFGTNSKQDSLPMWTSHKGICIGQDNGGVENTTSRRVDVPKGLKGTALFRHEDGQNHYVTVIQS